MTQRYTRLLINEIGYLPIDKNRTNLLFQVWKKLVFLLVFYFYIGMYNIKPPIQHIEIRTTSVWCDNETRLRKMCLSYHT